MNKFITLFFVFIVSLSFSQGDDCFNATSLGSLPTPPDCASGGGQATSSLTYNGTTNGATAENPYSSLACMDAPAADVWVTFTATGNEIELDFTSGLNDANIGIYSGDCTSGLTGLFCESSNNGNISNTLSPVVPGETYYMQISGADDTDFSNFNLDMTSVNNCDLCVLSAGVTASPAPTNGFYLPGTTVEFCMTINEFEQVGANWLAGVVPDFGSSWDISTLTPTSSPNAGGSYVWVWGTHPVLGEGWFVDEDPNGPAGPDGDLTNNYGDPDVDGTGTWSFCFEITTSSSCTPNGDLGMSVDTYSDYETGGYGTPGCSTDPIFPTTAYMLCCEIPLTSSTDESCPGALDGTISVTGQGGTAPYDYVFENSSGSVVYSENNVADGVASTATGLPADTYTITVTDDNGCEQIVDVTITVPPCPIPTLDPAPSNVTVQCIADVPVMSNLAWNDLCQGTGTVSGVDVSDGNTCPETITRTWTFTNTCGNSVSDSQVITVNDDIDPTGTAPAAVTVQCIGDVPAADVTAITDEADNCTVNPTVTHVGDVSDGNTCPETITRTYRIEDDCGNFIEVDQTITVDDDIAPTGTAPAAVAVQCIGDVPAADPTLITDEADNCTANPTVTHLSDVSDGNTCPETITRTYRITDDCGNTTDVTQAITVNDDIDPTGTAPAAVAVQCIGDVPAADPTLITNEADNCTANPTVTHVGDVSDGNTCPETITRTYRITDDCGNFIEVDQTITVDDTQDPTGTAPAAVAVQCIGDVPAVDINSVTGVSDNCTANPTVTHVGDVSDGNTCPEVITRTYRVADDCGNFIEVDQTITVNDDIDPTGTAPAAVAVQCIGDVPAVDVTAITDEADNCTANPTVTHVGDVSDGNTCPEVITRTYRIEDDCGNFIEVDQTITVDDDIDPTGTAPAAVSVQCIGDVPAVDVTAITDEADNCTANPTVTHVGDVSDGNTCPETITRTYRITDDCGNFIEVDQTITVDDDIDPTGTAPAAVTVQCIGDVPAADPTLITNEADNCTANPTVTHVGDVSDGNTCPETITRTYRIEDDCGNFIEVDQTITVDDDIDPTGTAPADVTVQCSGDVPAADPTLITDEADNCTANPTVTHVSDVSDGNTCPEVITRTYEITDDCGNSITVTQEITVDDTQDPTASNPAPISATGSAPAPDVIVVDDEADNCTTNPIVAFVSDVSDGQVCPETVTRTYSVTDDCGNQILVEQTITIGDAIMPTASNPPAVAVQCIGDVPAPDPTVVDDETDNGAQPIVTWEDDTSDGNTCPETITRRYRVTDDCGNFIFVEQTITVNDDIDPTGTAPAPVTVQCIGDVPAVDVTAITDEADNCTANPTVTHVGDVSDGNTCPEVITRTYRIEDDCGNFIEVDQTITVNDDIDPTGTAPAAVAVQCIGDVPVVDINSVTGVSDNCTVNPTVTHVGDVSDGNTCPEVITRTYRVEDDCGNFIEVDQTITVNDDIDPAGTAPAAVAVQCIGDVPAVDINSVTGVSDNCTTNPTVTHVGDVSDGNTCPEVITRTYRIEDDCGNFIEVDQTITVDDDIDPTGTAPAAVAVQCIGDVPAVDVTAITDEADNCTANPTVTHVGDVSDGNTCPEVITRTYRIEDDCGNFIEVEQTITVDDDIDPTGTAPADATVQCIGDVPVVDVTAITDEADNCTANPTVTHVGDVSDGNTCPEVITRTYRIEDDCGNFIEVDQIITVNDDIDPTGTAPAAVTVQCIGDVPAADPTLITDEADNCTANPTVTHVGDVSDGNTCPEVITRTYRIEDDCGNFIEVDQTITVDDDIAPTGTAPAAVAVQCIGDVPAADPTLITDEADNCTANPTVTHLSDVSDGNTCPETITRTYRITDDCGNTTDVTQAITVDDDIDPTGTAPAAVAVQCIGDVPAADPTLITNEADNCTANPTVTHVGDVSDGNTCPEVITRTYRIEDDCGNFIEVDQTITVDDDIDPTGTAPAAVTVQCIGDVPAADPTLITDEADNCTANPTVTFVADVSDGNTCPETITRTYRIEDDCGNFIEVDQTITVDDDIAPTASNPATTTVECVTDVPATDPTVVTDEADNCTATPTVTFVSEVSDNNVCNGEQITRTYEIEDDCGNTTTVTHTIIIDSYTPTFTLAGTDPTACGATDGFITVSGLDPNTDYEFSYNGGATSVITTDAAGEYVITGLGSGSYTGFTVSDADCPACSTTDGSTITLTDPNPPSIDAGVDQQVCEGSTVTLTADNPDGAIISWDNGITDGTAFTPAVGTTTYTVTADLAGCINTDQVDVTVAPTIDAITCPGGLTATCDISEQPAYADFYAFVADGGSATIPAGGVIDTTSFTMLSEVSDGNTCPETVTRTYQIADTCGVTVTCTQTIVINDLIDPTGTAPAAVSVQCIGDVPAVDVTAITDEADNCTANPTVTHVGDVSDGNTCPEVITRTYRITDDCGNFIEVDQTITVDDDIDPTGTAPAAVAVQCIGDVPAVDVTAITDEADNCTANPTVTHVGDVSDGNTCPEVITRTYRIEDDCGNFIEVDQTITVDDDIDPTGTAPAAVAVQCIGDVPAVDVTAITDEADNCTVNPTVTHVGDVSDGNTCPEVITRTYRIEDDCGNFIEVDQVITVDDDIDPTGTAPAAVAVQCIGDVPAVDINSVTGVSDNCTANPTVTHVGDVSDGNTCPEVITRTYRIEDDCGNFIEVDQVITVNDDIDPTGTAPAAVAVQCIGDVPAVDINSVTGVSDNCTANPTVTHVGDVSDGNTCPEVITRTYRIEDDCGNFIEVDQVITVNDDIDPTGTAPAAAAVQCIGDVPVVDINSVIGVSDNCTVNPTVTHVGDVSDGNTCPEVITRTYRVADDCGNFIEVDQIITVNDDIDPTGTAPAAVSVQCIGDVPVVDVTAITDEADNCTANPTVTHVGDVSDGNTCPEVITRTYRIEDDCGNFIEVDQIITVDDDIAPTASNPATTTVACATDVPAVDPTVVIDEADNCTANPTVTFISETTDNNVCNGEELTRVYEIEDDCGNTTTVTHTIIIDSYTPTFTVVGTDPTQCGATDGFITISGLNPNESYEISYNGNATQSVNADANGEYVITGLNAGSYTDFTVAPSSCVLCEASDNTVINLVDPNAPSVNAGPDQEVCEGVDVTLTADNPDGANISWDNGVTDGTPFTPGVGSINYTVTAELNNCVSTDIVQVVVNPIPDVNAGNDVSVCEGEQVTLSGSGADSYSWDNGVTNGVAFTPTSTTTYTVTGTSADGCVNTDDVVVTINENPTVSFEADTTQGCVPLTVNFTNLTSGNSTECVYTFSDGTQITDCNPTHTFTSAGCYDVTLEVTNDNGCVSSTTIQDYICVEGYPIADFTVDPGELSNLNSTAEFTNNSTGAYSYEWLFGDGESSTMTNPEHTYPSDEDEDYVVQLVAFSDFGCPDTVTTILPLREELVFFVPNTFTPDGDDYNQTFKPIFTAGFDPMNYQLLIFNRWGEVIFESNNAEVGWDGTYGAESEGLVMDGTYVWKIIFKTKYKDERQVEVGHVNVLK